MGQSKRPVCSTCRGSRRNPRNQNKSCSSCNGTGIGRSIRPKGGIEPDYNKISGFSSSPVPGGKRSDSNATNVYLRRRDGSLTKVDLDGGKADSAGKPERPWMDGPNPVRMSKAQFGIVDSIGGAAIDAVKGLGQAAKAGVQKVMGPKSPTPKPPSAPSMSRPGGGVRRGTGGVGLDASKENPVQKELRERKERENKLSRERMARRNEERSLAREAAKERPKQLDAAPGGTRAVKRFGGWQGPLDDESAVPAGYHKDAYHMPNFAAQHPEHQKHVQAGFQYRGTFDTPYGPEHHYQHPNGQRVVLAHATGRSYGPGIKYGEQQAHHQGEAQRYMHRARFAAGQSPLMPQQSAPPDGQAMYDFHMGHAKRYMDLVNHHIKMGKVALSPQDRAKHLKEAKRAKIQADQHTVRAQRHADAHAKGLPTAAGQGEGHMRAKFMGGTPEGPQGKFQPHPAHHQTLTKAGYRRLGSNDQFGGTIHRYVHPSGAEAYHWSAPGRAHTDAYPPGQPSRAATRHQGVASLTQDLAKHTKAPTWGGAMDAGVSPKPGQGQHIGSTVAATRGRQMRQSLDDAGFDRAQSDITKRTRPTKKVSAAEARKKRAREAQMDYLDKLNKPGGPGHPMGGYRSHGFDDAGQARPPQNQPGLRRTKQRNRGPKRASISMPPPSKTEKGIRPEDKWGTA